MNIPIIIGKGEIGTALSNVIEKKLGYPPSYEDKDDSNYNLCSGYNTMFICIPFEVPDYTEVVVGYSKKFKPLILCISTTTAPGTCEIIKEAIRPGITVMHIPVRGKHPDLVSGIEAFKPHVGLTGTDNIESLSELAKGALRLIHSRSKAFSEEDYVFCRATESELAKNLSLAYYATCITFVQGVKYMCDAYGVDFNNVFTKWQETYNDGWKELGFPQYMRPVLEPSPGVIGGHCVMQGIERILKHCDDNMQHYYHGSPVKYGKWQFGMMGMVDTIRRFQETRKWMEF
jgi:hypothetical protein